MGMHICKNQQHIQYVIKTEELIVNLVLFLCILPQKIHEKRNKNKKSFENQI